MIVRNKNAVKYPCSAFSGSLLMNLVVIICSLKLEQPLKLLFFLVSFRLIANRLSSFFVGFFSDLITLPKKLLTSKPVTVGWLIAAITLMSACSHQLANSTKVEIPAGVTLIEQVDKVSGQLSIPYKKYRLGNGLTVVLHHDDSDPLVHVDVTYHVGSAREQLGKSGFAHFFEHMMFQGSQNVADEQHFKIITESGGHLNGTTNTDRTNYYQTVPNNQLEKVLWLEADRMGYLLDAITEQKFEVQRATVKNERGQNVDNRPYGRLDETINQMLYPRAHPYSWPVIGYLPDLDRGNVEDLKQFFSRWYGPNNATLTIGGDFDETEVLHWVNRYFADINPGPEVSSMAKPLISLAQNRYYSFEDNVSLPVVYMAFPTVYAMHEDEAALDVLANILGAGPTSLLYQNLVKSGLAIQAGAGHPCKELACRMNFYAIPNQQQQVSLAQLEQAILDTFDEFEQRGVNQQDLLKTKVSIETDTIYGLQSVAGKVSSLAFYQTFGQNPALASQQVKRYNKVTQADVIRVYQKYIKGQGAAILSIVPKSAVELDENKGQNNTTGNMFSLPAQADNFSLPDISQSPIQRPLVTEIAKNTSSIDRSKVPPAGLRPLIKTPKYTSKRFNNGLTLLFAQNSETPTISMTLSMEGGPLLDTTDKAGLASLTAAMMQEGTTNYSKEALSNELALLGSDISVSASGRYTYIQVSSLTKHLPATMNLLLDVLLNPKFDQSDFDRIKNQHLQGLTQGLRDAGSLSSKAVKQVLYGQNNRLGYSDSGTLTSVNKITLDDVKGFYQDYYSPAHANLVVVGDVSKKALNKELEYLINWRKVDYQIPQVSADLPQTEANIYFVDLPGAAQSSITLVRHAMPYDALGEHFKSSLMNYPLGSAFNSRINLNLREDKGYTYGASSGYIGGKSTGQFQVAASVNQSDTVAAMREVEKELALFQEQGLTDDEVAFMRKAISQNEALSFETPSQKAGFLRQLLLYGLSKDYGDKQTNIILSITKQELNLLAKKELAKPMSWIVVGDGVKVEPQLAALQRPIIELTFTE